MKNKVFKLTSIMLLFGVVFLLSCKKADPDMENPTLTILSPTSEYSYLSESNTISISGIASDDTEIESIKWKDSHGNGGTAFGTENWEIRDITLQNGDNVFTITAYDKANKSASAEIMITYNEYLTYIGAPFISPNSVYVGAYTNVRFCATILPNPNLDENSVTVVEVDKNGNEINEICQLYDDGNLSGHGDEIKGDGVFSNITNFHRETPGEIYLRVKANTTEAQGTVTAYSSMSSFFVVDEIDNTTISDIFNTHEAGESKFMELVSSLPKDQAITQTIEFLNAQVNVSSAVTTESNDICITYTSGLKGMILTGEDGCEGSGSVRSDGREDKKIPLSKQTRGTYDENRGISTNPNTLIDRDVILYSPNYTEFNSWGTTFEDDVYQTLIDADCSQFNINYLKNEAANLDALQSLSAYGLIVIHTHGGLDDDNNVIFLSGEKASITNLHLIDWIMGRIYLGNDLKWIVRPSFISSYNNNLPNSIVYNGSCSSAYNTTMSSAFLSKGAQTYFGFSKTVRSVFDSEMANQLFPRIITQNMTTGNAFTSNQHDDNNPPAYFMMFGNSNLKYKFGFVNGDFEEGNLNGFITNGDGRVITQLSYIEPYEGYYMGIISTGLGYTEAQGSISQTFCLPDNPNLTLSFNWNFLSEEFLEYVGSQYQDYFKVLLYDQNGVEHILFSKSIDDIAAGYELTNVSPEIVFDQGGVYGTGWLNLNLDLSAYAGQHVTISFAASDIGDSIYDTAILLDNITIE